MLSFVGPSECVYSHSGQQTGHKGFHDGKGDLWVSYTQLHYQTPVAYSGLLCSHWRRVSLTLLELSLYFSECECICHHHIWVANPETWPKRLLDLPPFFFFSSLSVYLLVLTGWGPRLLPTKQQLQNFLTKRPRWPQMPIRAGIFSVFCRAEHQSHERLRHGPIQLYLNPQERSPRVHPLVWLTHMSDYWSCKSSLIREMRGSRPVPSWPVLWQSTLICLMLVVYPTDVTY